jgi:hypothetical protein
LEPGYERGQAFHSRDWYDTPAGIWRRIIPGYGMAVQEAKQAVQNLGKVWNQFTNIDDKHTDFINTVDTDDFEHFEATINEGNA